MHPTTRMNHSPALLGSFPREGSVPASTSSVFSVSWVASRRLSLGHGKRVVCVLQSALIDSIGSPGGRSLQEELPVRRTLFFRTVAAVVLMLGAGGVQAGSVFVGSVADWSADPFQFANDKTFIYVDSSGGWSGDELVTISSNVPQNSETLSIDGLSDYIGPQNLMIAYAVVISSSDVFGSISLDQNFSGATAITYKDIFASLADLQANPTPGTGTWALSVIDGAAGSTIALPGIQSIWIRDTITLSPSGSVLSVSNTIVQVPEPDMVPATACLAGGSMLLAWLARRRRTRRTMLLRASLGTAVAN